MVARPGSSYQLKVTLLETKPAVWRRVLVDGASTLDQLHEVLQAAFGWWDYHLREFNAGGVAYGVPDLDWDDELPTVDGRTVRLDEISGPGSSLRYVYDFGDDWDHKVTVENVLDDATPAVAAPLDGQRACPPKDCGGTWDTRSSWRSWPTQRTPSTTSASTGLGARSTPTPSIPATSPTTCAISGSLRLMTGLAGGHTTQARLRPSATLRSEIVGESPAISARPQGPGSVGPTADILFHLAPLADADQYADSGRPARSEVRSLIGRSDRQFAHPLWAAST